MGVLSIYLFISLVYLSIYYSHHGLSDFLQLVRSRQVVESPLNTSIKHMSLSGEGIFPRTSLSFSLKYLQEDIVSIYLSGRPIIKDVSSVRSVFKFRQEETNTQPTEYVTIYIFLFFCPSIFLFIYIISIHCPTIYHYVYMCISIPTLLVH